MSVRTAGKHIHEKEDIMSTLSRRDFITGGAAAGALVALSMTVGCAPKTTSTADAGDGASLAQTGGHSWETVPEPISADAISGTREADVVIVGAGPSGFCAAATAAENGLSVIMIEKDPGFNANGGAIFTVNSAYQKSIGYEVDAEAICHQYLEAMGKKVSQKNVWKFFDRSGEMADWFCGIMAKYGMEPVMQGIGYEGDPNNEAIPGTLVFRGGENTPTDVTDFDPYTCDLGLGYVPMVDYLNAMTDYITGLGVQIDYETASERILREDDGRVTGIVASQGDTYIQYNAAKGVVIASGDYGADEEMLEYFCPQAARFGSDLMISTMNTGDLHRQAMWVGADMQKWPDHAPSGFCGDAHPVWNLNVNKKGERFTNEYTSTSSLSWAIMQQEEGKTYSLFNEKYASQLPYVPGYIGADIPTPSQMIGAWDKLVEAGAYFKEDTLEALAADLELDPVALKKTVDDYNAMCAAGKDTDFHKPAKFLFALDEPPYYGFKNGVCMLTVHGGLHVDENSRVLTENDEVIEGLFAVGLAAGDFWANSYTTRFAGISHGHNMTGGYLVGRYLAGKE